MSEDVGGGGGIDMGKLKKGTILALCVEVRACTFVCVHVASSLATKVF